METLLSKRISVPDHVLCRQIEREIVILDLDEEKYFGLDDVGTAMWQALTETGSGSQALNRLLEEYSVDRETLTADLAQLLEHLQGLSLLTLHDD